jgi:thiamine-phosphate pyrophosphorylase
LYLYYITDRRQLSARSDESPRLLLERIRMSAEAGIDAIQLREKDLSANELVQLGQHAAEIVRKANSAHGSNPTTRFLINSRIDVAIACDADGVHLRSDDVSAADARVVFEKAGVEHPLIAVSCHTSHEVELAKANGADFAVFAPIFEKNKGPGAPAGIAELQRVCRNQASGPVMPVVALGGVTLTNAAECIRAGAAGIAGIRLFQSGNVAETVSRLRRLEPS